MLNFMLNFQKKKKGSASLVAMAATVIIAMLLLPTFATSLSTLFSGTDALNEAIQAQQYALIRSDIIRNTIYDDVTTLSRQKIALSEGYEEKVELGTEETDPITLVRRKIAKVIIYKENENLARYTLSVPKSTDAEAGGVPIGTIIIWGTREQPEKRGIWLECNGQSTSGYPKLQELYGSNVPDYRGVFLRGYGSANSNHYGDVVHFSEDLNVLQGDAIRNITGSINFDADNFYSSAGAISAYTYAFTGYGRTNYGLMTSGFKFDSSKIVPTANENRPINKAVIFLIKAAN